MDNKKLILQLKKGDPKVFKQMYLLYFDRLIGVARKFDLKVLTPNDFVQETFLHLYKQRHLLNEEVLFDKQLFVICKNLIINHINRENKVVPLHDFVASIGFEDDDADEEFWDSRKQHFQKMLTQLPEQQRTIFTLHKINNYSYDEIAAITGLSEKTIANHIYLANKFLQKKVAEL